MQCCPNCGTNLKRFEAQTFGNVTINEAGQIIYAGQVVNVSPSGKMLAEALIRASGRPMTREALANVIDWEGDIYAAGNYLTVLIGRIRKAFSAIDSKFDQLKVERDYGYRWEPRSAVELAALARSRVSGTPVQRYGRDTHSGVFQGLVSAA
jgi:DNA-binding response OmpR family regulator